MPRRGPPPKTTSSHDEGLVAEGLDSLREEHFYVVSRAVERPYVWFGLSTRAVERKMLSFEVSAHPVRRRTISFGLVTNAIEVSGSSIETEAMTISTRAVAPTGYPAVPRLSSARSVPVGPVVRRQSEIIPAPE